MDSLNSLRRKERQWVGQGHRGDEKIILPLGVAGPPAASNHLWAVTRPDWVGNLKSCSCFYECEKICITHSDLMDFPMFTPDSPFLLTCSDNESLMSAVPLPTPFPRHPPLLSSGSSCQVGMLCRPFHHLSQSHGDPLTCCLPGAQVSDSTSHRAVVWVVLQTPLEVIDCTRDWRLCDNVYVIRSLHSTISSSHRDKTVLQLS